MSRTWPSYAQLQKSTGKISWRHPQNTLTSSSIPRIRQSSAIYYNIKNSFSLTRLVSASYQWNLTYLLYERDIFVDNAKIFVTGLYFKYFYQFLEIKFYFNSTCAHLPWNLPYLYTITLMKVLHGPKHVEGTSYVTFGYLLLAVLIAWLTF